MAKCIALLLIVGFALPAFTPIPRIAAGAHIIVRPNDGLPVPPRPCGGLSEPSCWIYLNR